MKPLRTLRGAAAFAAATAWLIIVGVLVLYPFVFPLGLLWRARRRALVSWFMRLAVRGILLMLRAGGARFAWSGRLPTAAPSLILMNHQSQVDILIVTMMGDPYVPAFVPRVRYTHWYVPFVSACIRLLECPVVDPRRDARGALQAMRRAALDNRHGIVVFPEGHRSVDGEVRPFRPAGALACLEARRMPVYLLVTDGYWRGRRFVDFLGNVPHLRGRTELLGPFAPPVADAALPAFVDGLRQQLVAHLAEMRRRDAA